MRLIFSDIDGTLINSDFLVTPRTKEAIRRVVDQGNCFIPISARMPEAIKPIIDSIGITSPIISYNGALLQDENDETIASSPMTTAQALELCQLIENEAPEIVWNIYSYHDWYAKDRSDYWIKREENIVGVVAKEAALSSLTGLGAVHKVLLMGDPEKIGPLEVDLKKRYPDLSIAKSAPYFIEIMARGIRKGHAVEVFTAYMGLSLADTMAFGDNFNDLDMLQTVGKAYVMSNGPKEVQEAIGHVTADHDHDGIAQILERDVL